MFGANYTGPIFLQQIVTKMSNEFFPPTEAELEAMINTLKKKLEDDRYSDEWQQLAEELKTKEQQLKDLIIINSVI